MIKLLLFLLLAIPLVSFGQVSDDATDSIRNNRIGFAYSVAGNASKSVRKVGNMIFNNQYDSLRALLKSNIPALQYLSVRSCEFLEHKGKIILTAEEKKRISEIRLSDEKLEYRSGCTIQEALTIKELFANKKHRLNRELIFWLKELV